MIIKSPQTKEEFVNYYKLRWEILRKAWGQPPGSEKDNFEDSAYHIMAVDNGAVIGTGRIHFTTPKQCQIRFMAVEENYRNKGIGKGILEKLEQYAAENSAEEIILNARESAVKFYEDNGFRITKPAHELFGCIKHFQMVKKNR